MRDLTAYLNFFFIPIFILFQASLDQISDDLCSAYRERLQSDVKLQNMIKEREELLVFSMRGPIMEAINEHSVIIIRGNTGCGKTTQVKYVIS